MDFSHLGSGTAGRFRRTLAPAHHDAVGGGQEGTGMTGKVQE